MYTKRLLCGWALNLFPIRVFVGAYIVCTFVRSILGPVCCCCRRRRVPPVMWPSKSSGIRHDSLRLDGLHETGVRAVVGVESAWLMLRGTKQEDGRATGGRRRRSRNKGSAAGERETADGITDRRRKKKKKRECQSSSLAAEGEKPLAQSIEYRCTSHFFFSGCCCCLLLLGVYATCVLHFLCLLFGS